LKHYRGRELGYELRLGIESKEETVKNNSSSSSSSNDHGLSSSSSSDKLESNGSNDIVSSLEGNSHGANHHDDPLGLIVPLTSSETAQTNSTEKTKDKVIFSYIMF
jgi:hypothetical protein